MKIRRVVLYIAVMLVLLTTSVYATLQAELSFRITADDNKFYAGEEFILTVGLKNVVATEGVKSIEGYIDIDENVLEDITVNSIVTDSDGKVKIGNNTLPVYDANNISTSSEKGVILNTHPVSGKGDYKIVINLDNSINSDMELIGIKFKIKNNVEPKKYENVMSYKLFNIFSTDAGEKLELGSKSYSVTISEGTAPVNNNTVNNTTNNTNNNTVNNTATNNTVNNKTNNNTVNNTANNVVNNTTKNTVNNVVNNTAKNTTVNNTSKNTTKNTAENANKAATNTKVDNTVSPNKLPKTGYRIVLIPIIALAIVGFVFYKKYARYNKLDK